MAADAAPRIVVDSSVAVKWFLSDDESGVTEAMHLLQRHKSEEIVLTAPDLLLFEVSSALLKRGASKESHRDVVRSFSKSHIEFEPLRSLHAESVSLAIASGLSVCDAAFAALAVRLGATLVSADTKLVGSGACEAELLSRQSAG